MQQSAMLNHSIFTSGQLDTNLAHVLLKLLTPKGTTHQERRRYLANILKTENGLDAVIEARTILLDYHCGVLDRENRAFNACPGLLYASPEERNDIQMEIENALSAQYLEAKYPGTTFLNPPASPSLHNHIKIEMK